MQFNDFMLESNNRDTNEIHCCHHPAAKATTQPIQATVLFYAIVYRAFVLPWLRIKQAYGMEVWKAVVDVPCNLQRVVINLQRVVDINQ